MIIRLLTFFVMYSLGFMAFAQSPTPIPTQEKAPFRPPLVIPPGTVLPVWPEGKMPGHGADQPESRNDPKPGVILRITYVSQPTLEIFKAPGTTGPAPAMIICPGGGYGLLAYNEEGTEAAMWLNSLGITGIVLKYRVPNNREGAFQDIQRAMRMTRQHAAEWGIQPDKLGVLGFSAGGHLAARLSNNFEKAAYPKIDSADDLECRPDFVVLLYSGYLNVKGKLAPETTVTPSTPRTFLAVAQDDTHHEIDSVTYDAALTAANVPHEFHLYPTGGHGFGLRSAKDAKVWTIQAAAWLHKIGVLQNPSLILRNSLSGLWFNQLCWNRCPHRNGTGRLRPI